MKRTILVTGSTDGIGLATVKGLLAAGHNVIVHGRNEQKIHKALEQLNLKGSAASLVQHWACDLSSLKDIRDKVSQFESGFSKLDVVIHNAGVFCSERQETEDGFELTMAVNHLAPFAMTKALLPILKKSDDPRVIVVSSVAHARGHIDFNDFFFRRLFDGYKAYATSKLANILFTYELAERFKGCNLTANCLHPGVITTKLLYAGFSTTGDSTTKGAQTSIHLATSESLAQVTGLYFENQMPKKSTAMTYDVELRKTLWKASEELTGVRY